MTVPATTETATELTPEQQAAAATAVTLPTSIADHRKLYGGKDAAAASSTSTTSATQPATEQTPNPDDPTPAATDDPTQPHHSAAQRRDGTTGEFRDGKRRGGKAREAATRIDQLTGRAKTAEDRVSALEQELQQLRSGVTTTARPFDVKADPEPQEKDYSGDFQKYLDDRSRWVARQEYARLSQGQATERATAMARTSQTQELATFGERIADARARIKDLDASLAKPVPWLTRDLKPVRGYEHIDKWITRHPNGVDVLHYLQTHPTEIDALMRMEEFSGTEFLALLSQQRTASASDRPGATGSAATTQVPVKQPPTPPNPVRSGAQRTVDTAPPTDGSLSIAEHRKIFGPKRT